MEEHVPLKHKKYSGKVVFTNFLCGELMQIKVKYVNNGFAQLRENEKNFLLNAPVVVKT